MSSFLIEHLSIGKDTEHGKLNLRLFVLLLHKVGIASCITEIKKNTSSFINTSNTYSISYLEIANSIYSLISWLYYCMRLNEKENKFGNYV